jgi:DNA-binding winged helix-turn-helix (wHTH) protein
MSSPQWSFDRFRLDPGHACLWCAEQALALPPKAFDVLHYLVTHPDRLVTKDELLDAVWPQTAVSDGVVRMAIGVLRKALGDMAQTPRYIATVPRRGYRFLAPVTERTGVAPGLASLAPLAAPPPPPDTPETPPHPGVALLPSALQLEAERRYLTKSAEKPRHSCRGWIGVGRAGLNAQEPNKTRAVPEPSMGSGTA